MKRVFDYCLLFVMTGVMVILVGSGFPALSQQSDSQHQPGIAQEIQQCLPKASEESSFVYQFQFVTKQEIGDKTYHLLLVKDANDSQGYPWETLIAFENGQCENLIPVQTDIKTLTRFMSLDAAKQIALARYQELGKTPEGERLIRRQLSVITAPPGAPVDIDMDEYFLAPEDDWALRELGYSIPARFKTYPVETPSTQP